MNKNKIANKVLEIRKGMKLNQNDFSKLIGVEKSIIEDIELGEYAGDLRKVLLKICKVADIKMDYFKTEIQKIKKESEKEELGHWLNERWNNEPELKPLADFMGKMHNKGFILDNGEMTNDVINMCLKLLKPYIKKIINEEAKRKEDMKKQMDKLREDFNENKKNEDSEFLNKKIDDSLYKELLIEFPMLSD